MIEFIVNGKYLLGIYLQDDDRHWLYDQSMSKDGNS